MKKMEVKINTLSFEMEEAINRLRVNFRFFDEDVKKILITSSIFTEGKSMISIHLWRLLSEAGFLTVLIDADLRNSKFKEKHWGNYNKKSKGIHHYLSGLSSYDEVLYETNYINGYIIPVSDLYKNSSILLEKGKIDNLFDKLSEKFQYIIVDSPPLINVSDTILLGSKVDGSLFVVKSGKASIKLINQSLKQLQMINCPLLGIVFNQ